MRFPGTFAFCLVPFAYCLLNSNFPSPHPEALAVADAEDLFAVFAEVEVADPELGFDFSALQVSDGFLAMRADRVGGGVFVDADAVSHVLAR